jgi:outer membrane biosynthesis protein TonB
MNTAEFIIGHSADDADERKQEMRKVFWALLAALCIHLVIGYGLAVYGGLLYSPFSAAEEDKPVELSFVDLSATPAPMKNTMFVPNDESKQTEAPKDKTFESNANSIAASEQSATGSMPLPSQEGSERTKLDFNSQAPSLTSEGAQPQPSVAPQEQATPQPTVQPTPITKSDELAMLTSTPTPRPSVARKAQPPRSSYQPLREKTRLAGSISNRGSSAVNAIGTPLGRYQKLVYDAIGSRWYSYMASSGDLVSIGTVRVTFWVDRSGRVKPGSLKVRENSSNETFANVCLQSIMEIQLPPIPQEVASTLPSEGLEQEINFINFPNG